MKDLQILLILLSLIVGNLEVIACSCMGEDNIINEYNNSDIVVKAKVLSNNETWEPFPHTLEKVEKENLSLDSIPKNHFNGYYLKKVKVKVITDYKKNITQDTLIIYTARGKSGDCGFRFKMDKIYLIYGQKEVFKYGNEKLPFNSDLYPRFWTDICHRTQKVNKSELKKLEAIIGLDFFSIPIPIYLINL